MSIIVDNISYIYEKGTGFERQALKNVSCAIEDGEFIGLIGHTGSGKSTFIQHLNGLVKPLTVICLVGSINFCTDQINIVFR